MDNICAQPKLTFIQKVKKLIGMAVDEHRWVRYETINGVMVFTRRKCPCGADQVRFAELYGGEWQDSSIPLPTEWEQEWFDNAVPWHDSDAARRMLPVDCGSKDAL